MTTRSFISAGISAGTALGALAVASPVLAQPEMTYEERRYEYAQPAPVAQPQAAPIVYRQEAVVQPLPPRAAHAAPVKYIKDRAGADYEVEYEYDAPAHAASAHRYPAAHHAPAHPTHHAMPHPGAVRPEGHHGTRPAFDRGAWLDECVDRVSGGRHDRRDRNGNVIGGLVGAAAGGLIGNRVAGRGDRLAGTLIGAGVGGLAGLAVGSAIDGKKSNRNDDAYAYCEDYLARYSHGGGYGYQHHGYAYQYGRPMMLVPIWIQVPQRAVTREYVTYEYEDVEVVTYETVPARRRVIEHVPASKPVKRVKVQQSKPVRYRKGK